VILLVLLAAGTFLATAASPEGEGASYVGAERCKLCHRSLYESWSATPHARIAVPTDAADRCFSCHDTVARSLPAVQCEACHGPGSDYSPPEVMIDAEKAAMAGLVRPSIVVCERCHENEEPGHRGKLVMPEEEEWIRWIHEMGAP
jgi:hypothetical protein